ncbi:MAG: MamK family actin-like protein [Desulfobulbaceae bacterium]|nr:MamK family actin-like protein [Desulfobulbaceae bacterium]
MTVHGGDKLLLGIDLGTSRTAVMSDRGYKNIIRSVVGYPKDIIGIKMLGKTQIFGDEAMKRRSALTLYHPLQDGVVSETGGGDFNAAAELIRHVVGLATEGTNASPCGIIGVPARASVINKELLLDIARDIMSSVMVVSEPFMVAYALGKLNNAIIVDIGGGTIDICGMKGTVPTIDDQITFLKGGDFIDDRLQTAISQQYPETQVTMNLARMIKESYAFVGPPEEPVRVTLRAEGRPKVYDVTEVIRHVCESIVPEIIEHLAEIFRGYDPEDQPEVLQNIILAGGGSRIRGLDRMLEERFSEYGKVKVACVEDADYAGSYGALKMAQEVAPEYWDQVGFVGSY